MEQLATAGRSNGAGWSSGSISVMERGMFKPTIETLAHLALALDDLNEEQSARGTITIGDLLETAHPIELGDGKTVTKERLLKFLGGEPSGVLLDVHNQSDNFNHWLQEYVSKLDKLNVPLSSKQMTRKYFREMESAGKESQTEIRLAKKINIDVLELRHWAYFLWTKTFEQQRDLLAGDGATAQKKGRISRELLADIQTAMENNANGNG